MFYKEDATIFEYQMKYLDTIVVNKSDDKNRFTDKVRQAIVERRQLGQLVDLEDELQKSRRTRLEQFSDRSQLAAMYIK